MITRTPENRCLECGTPLNATECFETERAPTEGSLVACIRCGAVMMFAHDLTLRGMTDAEMDEVTRDHETMNQLARMVSRIHMLPKMN